MRALGLGHITDKNTEEGGPQEIPLLYGFRGHPELGPPASRTL